MSAPRLCGRPVLGVVMDLDGTLINTTVDFGLMKERVARELRAQGIPETELDSQGTTADSIERAAAYLMSQHRQLEVETMLHSMREVMNMTELERVAETTPVPGARECLTQLKGAGLRTGLLTRGSRNYALAALRHAGLDHSFDSMVCRDDFPEEEAKPNGKAMLRMAGMLGLRPEDCILVGDHAMDRSCALSVSSGFIGVLSGSYGKEEWSMTGCALIIDSVAALPDLLLGQSSKNKCGDEGA